MSWARTLLLKAAQNRWLRERAPQYSFVKRGVARFMPGEAAEDAFRAVRELQAKGIGAVLTALGENVADRAEAEAETSHYEDVLGQIWVHRMPAEISVKLTHLGLDLDKEFCFANLTRLIASSPQGKTVWIDMEQSAYVDSTSRDLPPRAERRSERRRMRAVILAANCRGRAEVAAARRRDSIGERRLQRAS